MVAALIRVEKWIIVFPKLIFSVFRHQRDIAVVCQYHSGIFFEERRRIERGVRMRRYVSRWPKRGNIIFRLEFASLSPLLSSSCLSVEYNDILVTSYDSHSFAPFFFFSHDLT
jgi:hypothetical protein